MRIAELDFRIVMTEPGQLSRYKGSMLRGAIGHALKKTCCNMPRQECAACMLHDACPYPRLFLAEKRDGLAMPPVYGILPGDDGRTRYAQGDCLDFTLRLYALATDYLPYFVQAVVSAGRAGLGRQGDSGRGTYAVASVMAGGVPVYDPERQRLMKVPVEELSLPEWHDGSREECSLRIEFLTPCRFKMENRLASRIGFDTLALLMLRRIRSLCLLEGIDWRLGDFAAYMETAKAVQTISSDLRWLDWTRWSNRQHDAMQLGGIIGSVVFRGPVRPFAPFFDWIARVQLGKQTSFGLGQISVAYMD